MSPKHRHRLHGVTYKIQSYPLNHKPAIGLRSSRENLKHQIRLTITRKLTSYLIKNTIRLQQTKTLFIPKTRSIRQVHGDKCRMITVKATDMRNAIVTASYIIGFD